MNADVLFQEFLRTAFIVLIPLFVAVFVGNFLSFIIQIITPAKEPVFLIPAQIACFFLVILMMSGTFFSVLHDFFHNVYSP